MIEQFKAGEILQLKANPHVKLKFIGMDDNMLVVKQTGSDGGWFNYSTVMTQSAKAILADYELPKKEMYVNLYADVSEPNAVSGSSYATKEEAIARRRNCAVNFLGTFKLEKV